MPYRRAVARSAGRVGSLVERLSPLAALVPARLVGTDLRGAPPKPANGWAPAAGKHHLQSPPRCERCRRHLTDSCAAAGFTPDIAFTTDDYLAAQSLVAAGLGVTTLPGLALAAHRHPGVRAIRLPGMARTTSAAVHGEAPDPPATAALLAHLSAAVAGSPL